MRPSGGGVKALVRRLTPYRDRLGGDWAATGRNHDRPCARRHVGLLVRRNSDGAADEQAQGTVGKRQVASATDMATDGKSVVPRLYDLMNNQRFVRRLLLRTSPEFLIMSSTIVDGSSFTSSTSPGMMK